MIKSSCLQSHFFGARFGAWLSLSVLLAACSTDGKAGSGNPSGDAGAGGADPSGDSGSASGGSAPAAGGAASGGSPSGTGGAPGSGGSVNGGSGGTSEAGTGGSEAGTGGGDAGTVDVCTFGGACGGDLTGTWDITSVCLPKEPEAMGICPTDLDSAVTGLGATGTLTVTGTSYTLDLVASVGAVYSAACLAPTQLNTCQKVATQLVTSFGGTAACTGSPSTSCDCIMELPQPTETGTVVIASNTVKLVKAGTTEPATLAGEYCVSGTTLDMERLKASAVDGGTPATHVYKATKQ